MHVCEKHGCPISVDDHGNNDMEDFELYCPECRKEAKRRSELYHNRKAVGNMFEPVRKKTGRATCHGSRVFRAYYNMSTQKFEIDTKLDHGRTITVLKDIELEGDAFKYVWELFTPFKY